MTIVAPNESAPAARRKAPSRRSDSAILLRNFCRAERPVLLSIPSSRPLLLNQTEIACGSDPSSSSNRLPLLWGRCSRDWYGAELALERLAWDRQANLAPVLSRNDI